MTAKRRNGTTIPSLQTHPTGVSGISLYVPPLRVRLEQWCEWTGNPWAKIEKVVGRSFRYPAANENVYTMAANAAMRLIESYAIDPGEVGFLALGTESSTDNSAGAVIVRGMLDRALEQRGLPRLSRSCEVPEFKHACLGGVYGLKGALRYVQCDGAGRKAIVVCGDVAEYERGSTGEQTQGAGAVAMLVEENPRLFEADLRSAGSGSAYRGPDFRKPFARHFMDGYADRTKRLHDFPVFRRPRRPTQNSLCRLLDRGSTRHHRGLGPEHHARPKQSRLKPIHLVRTSWAASRRSRAEAGAVAWPG